MKSTTACNTEYTEDDIKRIFNLWTSTSHPIYSEPQYQKQHQILCRKIRDTEKAIHHYTNNAQRDNDKIATLQTTMHNATIELRNLEDSKADMILVHNNIHLMNTLSKVNDNNQIVVVDVSKLFVDMFQRRIRSILSLARNNKWYCLRIIVSYKTKHDLEEFWSSIDFVDKHNIQAGGYTVILKPIGKV